MVAIFLLDLVSIMKLLQLLNLKLLFNQPQWLWSSNNKWFSLRLLFNLKFSPSHKLAGFIIPTVGFLRLHIQSAHLEINRGGPFDKMDPFVYIKVGNR